MRDLLVSGVIGLLAAAPSSSTYILRNYEIGSGGTSGSSSASYRLNGVSGTQTGDSQSSTTYKVTSGLASSQTVAVPVAPTFTNPSNYYNQLRLTINKGTDPSDTKYLIAISTDNFATITRYVQTDNTVGATATLANYQLYTAWGGASGFLITGLTPSTTYQVKLKAIQGGFTNTGFGPTASAATVATSVSISLSTNAVGFSSLTPGSVVSGSADAVVGLSSNAQAGGDIYIKSANAGLASAGASTSINSVTTDLASAGSGYGVQVTSVTQASGGPLAAQAPFASSADQVGGLTTSLQKIVSTTAPLTTGSATIRLKAKASNITPSSGDYSDQLTLVAAMNF